MKGKEWWMSMEGRWVGTNRWKPGRKWKEVEVFHLRINKEEEKRNHSWCGIKDCDNGF